MKLAEEKKLVKEIEQLKQSRKTAAQYVSQEEVSPFTYCGGTNFLSPSKSAYTLIDRSKKHAVDTVSN